MLTEVQAPGPGQQAQGSARVPVALAIESDRAAWDAYVAANPEATGYHEWAWRSIFTQTFGHHAAYLIARDADGRVRGVLPTVFIKSLLFGRTLTSLPFLNYGGVLADDDVVARALVDAGAEQARALGCTHLELRHLARRFPDLPCKQHKVTMRLPLAAGMWERLDRKVRNQVRKAEKSNLTAARGGAELVGEFYTVFARNMRDLGTPVYSRRLFDDVARAFPDRARIVVVRLNGAPIAAGFTFRTRTMVEIPWASSIRDYNNLCPNHLLYWHAIEAAVADGCDVFDFGRSTPDEGTYKFKEQWGAAPVPLHWEYCLVGAAAMPDQSPKNPKFQRAINMWQRLPLWLANAAGPYIVRDIP
ncbi:MAG TPA: FemAB family XrtA/PEP-CTERM system-associated protein [Vicinamibacterales bacterium]|nr:FemAB family XrtA/PEP-CTERM system-associated protein [Vicinamibacterales bacterium]